jgi:hypothetical protein
MSIDIYNNPPKTVTVLCHTSAGDDDNEYFIKGNEYELSTEYTRISEDTNNQECILCWVHLSNIPESHSNNRTGARFTVKGNEYRDAKELGEREPYYSHFTKYFVCPIQRDRDNKLNQIGI